MTTSGCSGEFMIPSWQIGPVAGACGSGTKAFRATADLSAAATYTSGGEEAAIASYQGGWQPVEGTSASSPLAAAILARLGLAEKISE